MRALAVGLLLLAGSAAASADVLGSNVYLSLAPPDAPIEVGGTVRTPVTVGICWAGPRLEAVHFALHVASAPDWARVAVEPDSLDVEPGISASVSRCEERTVHLVTSVLPTAPAFEPGEVHLTAQTSGDALHEASATTETTLVSAAWRGGLAVEAPDRVALADGSATFDLRVANLGNAHTRVLLEQVSGPGDVLLPPPVVLESRLLGGTATTADIPVRIVQAQAGALHLRVMPLYALDGKLTGPPSDITVHLTEGMVEAFSASGSPAGSVPLPAWTGLFGALVGAGVWFVRRR